MVLEPTVKRLMVTALLLFLCSCDTPPKPIPSDVAASTFRAPSATELFDLQSKCTVIGQKIMEDNLIGNALTQEQVSHYNPKDNRCYVRLTVHTANLAQPREKYTEEDSLYDGQVGEMLAYVSYKGWTKRWHGIRYRLEKAYARDEAVRYRS